MNPAFLQGLNPEQHEAVTLPDQPALIVAGAGSGKTRVLTMRIAHLIQSGRVSPHGILAVTFTNKAAKEMLTRLSALLPINTRGMWVGTFHGLCNRLLRAHHREAGLPALFQILDSQDQLAAVKRVMKALNVDEERYPPRQAAYFINSAKEQGLRADKVEAFVPYAPPTTEIYAAYDEQCRREGAVDFAELLLRAHELLQGHPLLREHYQQRFRHILVDEFQDTSRLQYDWLTLLAGGGAAVFAVGDDDQSIYAFRGAHSRNMQDFERDFGVEKVIKLERNYRSHGNILEAANALIRYNPGRLGKNLWTDEGGGESLRLFIAPSDREEADYVVEEVRALAREGVALSEMAVLYRSNAQSRALEHALFMAGVSYRVYGGLRFFERQEVKHALAYLRLLANPHDDGAFQRVVNFPPRGIGARTLEQLQEVAAGGGASLWTVATHAALGGKGGTSVRAFVALLENARAATAGLPLAERVDHVLEASGLREHYRKDKQDADRLENLEELVNAAAFFESEHEPDPELPVPDSAEGILASFLAHAALEAGEHQAGSGQEALQLMTVHSAKGLEFHTVFITGLEEGLFPHENAMNDDGGLEEERRLMYVAITRARRRLYLTYAESRLLHGQVRYGLPSRFLREIPPGLVKTVGGGFRSAAWDEGGAAVAPTPVSRETGGFQVGQGVVHPKFGAGVIMSCEGRGADARVQVNFRDEGPKWLMLEYARLTPA